MSRHARSWVAGLASAAVLAGLAQTTAVADTADPLPQEPSSQRVERPASSPAVREPQRQSLLGAGWQDSADRAWTTSSDAQGFHILVADKREGYGWKTAASLSEPGFEADAWIGNACVTASGNRAVVVYAPRTFTNEPKLMARGAFTAVVELETGKVTKLPLQASLAYYNPGCGVAEKAVLTQAGGEDKAATRLFILDVATGKLSPPIETKGQVTSAVIAKDDSVVGANGARIVKIDAKGQKTALVHTESVPYRLAPDADGGIVFLDKQAFTAKKGTATADAQVQQTQAKRITAGQVTKPNGKKVDAALLAAGPLTETGLTQVAGTVYLTGKAKPAVGKKLPRAVRQLAKVPKDAKVSTRGEAVLTETAWADGQGVLLRADDPDASRPVHVEMTVVNSGKETTFTVDPSRRTSVHSKQGRDRTPALAAPKGGVDKASTKSTSSGGAGLRPKTAGTLMSSADRHEVVESERVCSVPRNDPRNQAMQPKPRQVEWAVNQAIRNNLNAHISRPANWKNLGMPAYQPQSLFPAPALEGGGSIPAQVMLGVTTQESNMWQASRIAVPGVTSSPLIGNYYGIDYYDGRSSNDWDIDWTEADCGYGIMQVTDHMRLAGKEDGHGGTAWPYQTQRAVALDYTANVAAGMQILASKWNETRKGGLKVNNGNSAKLENWTFALWAYNSGFYPNKGDGSPWGVGWANNPANPEWDAGRTPFMEDFFGNEEASDAAHPQDWPYQEKVLGFAAHPPSFLEAPGKMVPAFLAAWWNGTEGSAKLEGSAKYNRARVKPAEGTFCTAANACDPDKIGDDAHNGTGTGPCTRADYKCWWNQSVTWKDDCDYSCGNDFTRFPVSWAEEPDGTAYPPSCTTSGLPAGALVVDNVPAGTPTVRPGCANSWTNQGTFTFDFGDGETACAVCYVRWPAKIDTHQLGAGFGGHFYFGHTRKDDAKGQRLKATGTWQLNQEINGWSRVMVHMPDHGAHTRQAKYLIDTGNGIKHRVALQRTRENRWVDLGVFQFAGTPKVSLSTITADGTGDEDIAWDAVAFQKLPGKPKNFIVAMGDSYSSGEGASASDESGYYKETNYYGDDDKTKNACHRSRHTWSRQAALPGSSSSIGALADSRNANMDYHLIACSGARSYNITRTSQNGELPQIDKGYLDENTTLVTISIGGNDAQFADIVQACFKGAGQGSCMTHHFKVEDANDPELTAAFKDDFRPMADIAEDVIVDHVTPRIVNSLKAIKAKAPNAKIVLMGYPPLMSDNGSCVPTIDQAEGSWMNSMGNLLNRQMDKAAASAGATFADPTNDFKGKAICGDPETVHGIVLEMTESDVGVPVSAQSFHPKISGARLYADALEGVL
ncbi:NocE [Streptomyces spongiicola]|uniref:NocE n=1 Tax=Streptomyces spongiicola TaxID=1690221 RepID=A0ABM6V3F5_9ACTN|nr:NocE [Streptomyces spongiicola]